MSSFAKSYAALLSAFLAGSIAGPAFASHQDELWNYINGSSYVDPNVVNRLRKTHRDPQLNLEIIETPDGRLGIGKPLTAKQKKQRAEQLAKKEPPVEQKLSVQRNTQSAPDAGHFDRLALAFAFPYRMTGVENIPSADGMAFALAGLRSPVQGRDNAITSAPLVTALPAVLGAPSVPPVRPALSSRPSRRPTTAGPIQSSARSDARAPQREPVAPARQAVPTVRTERKTAPPRVAHKPVPTGRTTVARRPAVDARRRVVARKNAARVRIARRDVLPRVAPDLRYDPRLAQRDVFPRSAPDFRLNRRIAVRVGNPGRVTRTYARIKTFIRRIF